MEQTENSVLVAKNTSPNKYRIIIAGAHGGDISIWNIQTNELTHVLSQRDGIYHICCSPDNKYIATACVENNVKILSAESFKLLKIFSSNEYVSCMCFSPDSKKIITGNFDSIQIWDIESGEKINGMKGYDICHICCTPDSKYIIAAYHDKTIKIWDFQTCELVKVLTVDTRIGCISASPNGKYIASGNYDSTVKIWDIDTGNLVRVLTGHRSSITTIDFSSDSKLILSAGFDRTIKQWNVETGELISSFGDDFDWTLDARCLPGTNHIVSGNCDNTILILDAKTGDVKNSLRYPGNMVRMCYLPYNI
jgi:WD40 repeat protein